MIITLKRKCRGKISLRYKKDNLYRYSRTRKLGIPIRLISKANLSKNDPLSYTDTGVLRLTYTARNTNTSYDFLGIKKTAITKSSLWNRCNTPENRRRY